ncbi:MAG: flagellar protein FlgN [Magnetococcales bacterium]|nr:flagellar protein FlgN [Magnetococcales bacterium]
MATSQPDVAQMIKTEVGKLIELATPMVALYRTLSHLLEQEREALNQRNPDRLEELATHIGHTLEEIHAHDQLRQKMTRQLGARLGLSGERLNLKSLDEALGGNTGLIALRGQLTEEIAKADRINRHNQAAFTGVLSATESILRALKESTQGPVASYNRKGNRHASTSRFHLISKQL